MAEGWGLAKCKVVAIRVIQVGRGIGRTLTQPPAQSSQL